MQSVLEALQESADLRIGPAGIADDLAANYALPIDDVGFRPAFGTVHLRDGLIWVTNSGEVDVKAIEESAVGAGVFVDADGEDGQLGVLVMQGNESGCLLNTWWALTPPEVQQNDFASIVLKTNRVFAVGHGEIRSDFTGLCWMGAAVATGRHDQRKQAAEAKKARKPHILIITERKGSDRW